MSGQWITAQGFKKPTLLEFQERLRADFEAIWGPEFDTGPTTPAGNLIGVFAKGLADAANADEEVVSSLDPSQATGLALSRIASLLGTFRLGATPTTVDVICYSQSYSISPGRTVRRSRGNLAFSLLGPVTINRSACRDIYIKFDEEPTPGDVVTLSLSFGDFATTIGTSFDQKYDAYLDLANKINAWASANGWTGMAMAYRGTTPPLPVSPAEDCLRIWHPYVDFGMFESGILRDFLVGSLGKFSCQENGPETVEVGEIDRVDDADPAWYRVYNMVEGIPGKNVETDEELRIRMYLRRGKATEESILREVLNSAPGVNSVMVKSNRTMVTDAEGRPPKSVEIVVSGGDEQNVAEVIWSVIPAGIETWADMSAGGVRRSVIDSQGFEQSVMFGRPVTRYLYAYIVLTPYSEEAFPGNGLELLRTEILKWASAEFIPGKNVIPQRFYVPIYKVPGIKTAVVQVAVSSLDTDPNIDEKYTTSEIQVGTRENLSLLAKNLILEVLS